MLDYFIFCVTLNSKKSNKYNNWKITHQSLRCDSQMPCYSTFEFSLFGLEVSLSGWMTGL